MTLNTRGTRALPEVLAELRTSEHGLSADEAAKRLREGGRNALPVQKPDPSALIFARQFQSPLIYILLAASAAVFLMGETVDGAIILAVLVFNAVVGTIQEGKAQNTLRALKGLVETTAVVMREEKEMLIPDQEVVQGDIILLQEGAKVPADARLILAQNLRVDESMLTGESEPVSKTDAAPEVKNLEVADQVGMVFKGTNVVAGNGTAVVTATGLSTAIGKIAKEVSSIDTEVPLKTNIRYLSRAIIAVVAGVGLLIFVLGLFAGYPVRTMFATVVSFAVSVIPEGLPIVMTLILATGVWRMAKRNALVKRLQAVEALGQAQVIAVDKTGTITRNELIIQEVWVGQMFRIGGIGYEPKGDIWLRDRTIDPAESPALLYAGKIAALSASARALYSEEEARWRVTGDPTEAAMFVFGQKVGFHKDTLEQSSPLMGEIPFDYRLKYHATVHTLEGKNFLTVVGAPEEILGLSTHIWREGVAHPLVGHDREEFENVVKSMSGKGLRVIAFAVHATPPHAAILPEHIGGLTLVGLYGMKDALREEVPDAMRRAEDAGIRVVMITGDHTLTARSIAKEAGIFREGDAVLTGKDIDALSDDALSGQLAHVSVFARVNPEHKLRIIQAYKKRGEIVAMTGDGVNDAPSLVAADLGVAMGKQGTEVAKEAADIVLLDDNFGSIISAVEEGRGIYLSIQKVILYLFSTSAGEAVTIVGALLLGLPLPLLAAQIIWLNLVTDGFLDVALAMEPHDKGMLKAKFKRPPKYMVDGAMTRRIVLVALVMAIGTLYLFKDYVGDDMQKAWTIALTTLAAFQWFNAWNCRSDTHSIFSMDFFSNTYLLGATAIVVALQFLAVYHPLLQRILHTVPLSFSEWVMIIIVATTIIIAEEIRKFTYRWRTGNA